MPANNEEKNPINQALIYIIVALLGGTSAGILVPKAAPEIARPDPATGKDLKALESRVDAKMREYVAKEVQLHSFRGHTVNEGR